MTCETCDFVATVAAVAVVLLAVAAAAAVVVVAAVGTAYTGLAAVVAVVAYPATTPHSFRYHSSLETIASDSLLPKQPLKKHVRTDGYPNGGDREERCRCYSSFSSSRRWSGGGDAGLCGQTTELLRLPLR